MHMLYQVGKSWVIHSDVHVHWSRGVTKLMR